MSAGYLAVLCGIFSREAVKEVPPGMQRTFTLALVLQLGSLPILIRYFGWGWSGPLLTSPYRRSNSSRTIIRICTSKSQKRINIIEQALYSTHQKLLDWCWLSLVLLRGLFRLRCLFRRNHTDLLISSSLILRGITFRSLFRCFFVFISSLVRSF
jgi:hypothetical protein